MTDDLTAQVRDAMDHAVLLRENGLLVECVYCRTIYAVAGCGSDEHGTHRSRHTPQCNCHPERIAAALLTVAEALTPSGAPQDMRAQDQAIAAGVATLRGTEEPCLTT